MVIHNNFNRLDVNSQRFSRTRLALPRNRVGVLLLSLMLFTCVVADNRYLSTEILESIRTKYGHTAENRVRLWQQLIRENTGKTDQEKLELVNDFFNGARFVNDINLWQKSDYWATPIEFLIKDAGDCEDFSIAKYFTLTEMGVDVSKLRITYVKALTLNQAHMVLAYYETPTAEPTILDNINKRLRPASQRSDLQPVYSFNAEDLWLARSRNIQLKAGNAGQIGMWRDLNRRMEREFL